MKKASSRLVRLTIIALLVGLLAWEEVIRWKVGICGSTPEQVAQRFGRRVFDSRQHDSGGTSQHFDFGYYTWTGGKYLIYFQNGKATGSKYYGSK